MNDDAPGTVSAPSPTRPSIEAAPPGLVVIVLALMGAALARPHTLVGLSLAYLGAWLGFEAMVRTRLRARLVSIPRIAWLGMAVVPIAVLVRDASLLVANEGLRHVETRLFDRERGRVDPTLLRTDAPRAFLISAPSAEHVALTLGGIEHAGTALGGGVFRVDVDPEGMELPGDVMVATITIDGATHREPLRVVRALPHPRGLVRADDGHAACAISEETDELYVVDEDGLTRTAVGDRPVACAFEGSVVWVATRTALEAWEDGARLSRTEMTGTLTAMVMHEGRRALLRRVPPSGAEGLASELIVDETLRLEELNETLRLEDDDAETLRLEDDDAETLRLEGIADHVAFLDRLEGPALVVALRAPARLLIVDLRASPTVIAERALRAPAIALAARGNRIAIATADFAEDAAPHLGNHFIDDQLVLFDDRLAVQAVLHTAGRTPAQDHAGDIDVGAGPRGLSFDEHGALLVSFEGSREVVRHPSLAALPERHGLGSLDAEAHAPESAVRLDDGTLVIASPASGCILRVRGDVVRIERLGPSARELLHDDPEALRVRMGELAFGEATRSGVSCASCHLFGGSDFTAHNIGGRVLAPTLDVRGIAGTAPYLRDGSYPRLSDLHEVALEEYRGYRRPAGDRGATVEGFLETTARPQTFASPDPDLARRGAELFVRAECVHCHVPPAFTDLGLHAGTALFPEHRFPTNVGALDTPSLRGLSESPPYLYDGRAATLRDVLTRENHADRHGHTQDLSDEQLDALVAFLEALP